MCRFGTSWTKAGRDLYCQWRDESSGLFRSNPLFRETNTGKNSTKAGIFPALYLTWTTLVIVTMLIKDRWSHDNVTHGVILLILLLSLGLFRHVKPKNTRRFFIGSCVLLAALGEGAYMITKPVLPSLLVSGNCTLGQFIHHYGVDLLLTIPVYVAIFWVIWRLIHRYAYSTWEYIFWIALGQALGDGFAFFLVKPLSLLMIPYIMLNYHAMNVAPFLCIQDELRNQPRMETRWKYAVTPLVLFVTYFLGGTMIHIVAKIFNLDSTT